MSLFDRIHLKKTCAKDEGTSENHKEDTDKVHQESHDSFCFPREDSPHPPLQFNAARAKERSQLGLRSSLSHGYNVHSEHTYESQFPLTSFSFHPHPLTSLSPSSISLSPFALFASPSQPKVSDTRRVILVSNVTVT